MRLATGIPPLLILIFRQVTLLCQQGSVRHSKDLANNLSTLKLDNRVLIVIHTFITIDSIMTIDNITGYVAPEDKGMLGDLGSGALNMVKPSALPSKL